MYHITGADGKEYGPVTLQQIEQWIAQGRVNEGTLVRAAGVTEWQRAGEMPDLIPLFRAGAEAPERPGQATPPPLPSRKLAVASLVLGVLSIFCLAPLTAIPAIICGHMARSRIRRLPALYHGANQALAGVILGYLSIFLMTTILAEMLLPVLTKAKDRAQEINCINNMKQVAVAFNIWRVDNGGKFPFHVSTNAGGTLEFALPSEESGDPNSYRHLAVLGNAISNKKILICPADVKTWVVDPGRLAPENVSYEIMSGPNVTESNPEEVLARCPIHNHRALVNGAVLHGSQSRR